MTLGSEQEILESESSPFFKLVLTLFFVPSRVKKTTTTESDLSRWVVDTGWILCAS